MGHTGKGPVPRGTRRRVRGVHRRGKTPRSDGATKLEVFPSTVCAQTCTTDTTQSKRSNALDGVAIRCPRAERPGPYGDYLKCGKTEFVRAIFYGRNGRSPGAKRRAKPPEHRSCPVPCRVPPLSALSLHATYRLFTVGWTTAQRSTRAAATNNAGSARQEKKSTTDGVRGRPSVVDGRRHNETTTT